MTNLVIRAHREKGYPTEWEVSRVQEFDRSSLNAGRVYLQHVAIFGSLTEAQQAYPEAEHTDTGEPPTLQSDFDYLPDEEMTAYQEQSYWDNYDGRRDW